MVRCGAAVILPTYPAWSFGHKYPNNHEGPGGAFTQTHGSMGNSGPAMGPPTRPHCMDASASPGGMHNGDLKYTGPLYSMGKRLPIGVSDVPGPGGFNPDDARKAMYGPGWGPPPRPRVPSAPPAARRDFVNPRITRGPTIGLPLPLSKDLTPAPHDYQPHCSFGCNACDHYRGPSLGIRHRQHVPFVTPGADAYHVDCETLGAAAKGCPTGSDPRTFTKPDRLTRIYTRQDDRMTGTDRMTRFYARTSRQ
jgi:hypothetical protein